MINRYPRGCRNCCALAVKETWGTPGGLQPKSPSLFTPAKISARRGGGHRLISSSTSPNLRVGTASRSTEVFAASAAQLLESRINPNTREVRPAVREAQRLGLTARDHARASAQCHKPQTHLGPLFLIFRGRRRTFYLERKHSSAVWQSNLAASSEQGSDEQQSRNRQLEHRRFFSHLTSLPLLGISRKSLLH